MNLKSFLAALKDALKSNAPGQVIERLIAQVEGGGTTGIENGAPGYRYDDADGGLYGRPGGTAAARASSADARHLRRVFASHDRPASPFSLSASGGITATHMYRPTKAIDPDKLVKSTRGL